ncbi:hypothetical protein PYCCODRAFT_1465390 [Trametes coccinea BRFM310]|uniref:BTB domain-containing protein n=1 Tax=Trametes coccinea (strain BRFM310) TaxID=1353009 RepID=A0A1Y2IWL5_TRAC3|nr:hypothetical protein PYCCODRAFT_1465390 [Trametes coccinea BRFM310]
MADATPNHPFTDSSADIVFCLSDHVRFRLHRIILSIASDFFKDMFALPQPATITLSSPTAIASDEETAEIDGLPVVHVSESSIVLEGLFRLCYPVKDPPLDNLAQVRPVLEAALKYQMHEAIEITTRRLLDLAQTEPLRVYAIACLHSLADVVTAAARAVFDQQLMDKYVDELEEIPVSAYRRLLSYCGSSQATGKGEKLNGPFPASLDLEYSDLASVTPSIKPTDVDDAYDSVFLSDVEDFGSVASDTPNVIIRTCDEQDIKFSADMLRVFSPVLAASLSMTSSQSLESPRVITVPEPCDIMRPLLAMYHPLALPPALDAPALVSALVAAEKYQMKKAVWLLRDALSKLEADPSVDVVWLYFVACRFSMRSLAHAAARRCLRLQDLATSSFANVDFPGVNAGTFWRLLDYQRRCRTAIRSMLDADPATWMSEEWQRRVQICYRNYTYYSACWLPRYMNSVKKLPCPSGVDVVQDSVLRESLTQPLVISNQCSSCGSAPSILSLCNFSKYLAETMETRENEVALEWKGPIQ